MDGGVDGEEEESRRKKELRGREIGWKKRKRTGRAGGGDVGRNWGYAGAAWVVLEPREKERAT